METESTGASIEGSYELVARELPDGSRLEPPDVFGFMSFTAGHRLFHIYTPAPEGGGDAHTAYTRVSAYRLTETEYSETLKYEVTDDAGEASGPTYRFSGSLGPAPVTVSDRGIQFRDIPEGPILASTSAGLTATDEGEFVDHWVKVR
ncbi:MAG: hypothetical protein GWO17_00610 [Gemmatimonadetes bacterium]|nr:hypothetical protein [Gemmatimonadota bacterium]